MPLYIFKVTRKLHQKYFSVARILWFIIRRSKIFGCELWIHFKVELLQIVYRSFMHPCQYMCVYVCMLVCSLHSIVVIYKIFTGLFLQIHIFTFSKNRLSFQNLWPKFVTLALVYYLWRTISNLDYNFHSNFFLQKLYIEVEMLWRFCRVFSEFSNFKF